MILYKIIKANARITNVLIKLILYITFLPFIFIYAYIKECKK